MLNMRAADYSRFEKRQFDVQASTSFFFFFSSFQHLFVLMKAQDNPKTTTVSLPKEVLSTQTQWGCDWQLSHLKIGFGEQTQNPSAFFLVLMSDMWSRTGTGCLSSLTPASSHPHDEAQFNDAIRKKLWLEVDLWHVRHDSSQWRFDTVVLAEQLNLCRFFQGYQVIN